MCVAWYNSIRFYCQISSSLSHDTDRIWGEKNHIRSKMRNIRLNTFTHSACELPVQRNSRVFKSHSRSRNPPIATFAIFFSLVEFISFIRVLFFKIMWHSEWKMYIDFVESIRLSQ